VLEAEASVVRNSEIFISSWFFIFFIFQPRAQNSSLAAELGVKLQSSAKPKPILVSLLEMFFRFCSSSTPHHACVDDVNVPLI
jgi:hypothetical protein